MAVQGNRPIIIKRKKIIAGGHHGGAWKVAYADFVTAMMAFFLLMWLLGATTEEQRRGIADFFNPTIPVKRVSGGGDGAFGGDSPLSETSMAKTGIGGSHVAHSNHDRAMGASGVDDAADADGDGQNAEAQVLEDVQEALLARSGESMISDALRQHMLMRVTDEGLVVELFDLPGRPLFDARGNAQPILTELLRAIGAAFDYSSNQVAIKGFVRSVPVVLANPRRFELSIENAETVRQRLSRTFDERRIQRVAGFGDRELAVNDATAIRNNRIELVLLR